MGFSINELVEGKGYKKFMAKLYGWGASIVLVGALFKIQHWPFAGEFLTVGLSTEAIIFFFSAFEPIHEDIDWTLVYPELAGIDIDDEDTLSKKVSKKSALEKFDSLLEKGEITPDLFQKLGNGLRSLNTTTEKLQDVASATVATNNYVANFEKASEKVNEFAEFYGQSSTKVGQSAEKLSSSYEASANIVAKSASDYAQYLSDNSSKVAEKVIQSAEKLTESYTSSAGVIIKSATDYAQHLADNNSKITEKVTQSAEQLSESYANSAGIVTKSVSDYAQQLSNNSTKLSDVVTVSGEELAKQFTKSGKEIVTKISDSSNEITKTFAASSQDLTKLLSEKSSELSETIVNSGTKLSDIALESGKKLSGIMEKTGGNVTELVSASAAELASSYKKLSDSISNELSKASSGTNSYSDQLEMATKNLTALNTVYEIQLQDANQYLDSTKELYGGLHHMLDNLNKSIEDTKRYREEVSKLGSNLAALNTIYGNMLTAMNYHIEKQT